MIGRGIALRGVIALHLMVVGGGLAGCVTDAPAGHQTASTTITAAQIDQLKLSIGIEQTFNFVVSSEKSAKSSGLLSGAALAGAEAAVKSAYTVLLAYRNQAATVDAVANELKLVAQLTGN